MADIAAIFHWPLATLEQLTLDELLGWRERAIDCWNRMHGDGKSGGKSGGR